MMFVQALRRTTRRTKRRKIVDLSENEDMELPAVDENDHDHGRPASEQEHPSLPSGVSLGAVQPSLTHLHMRAAACRSAHAATLIPGGPDLLADLEQVAPGASSQIAAAMIAQASLQHNNPVDPPAVTGNPLIVGLVKAS